MGGAVIREDRFRSLTHCWDEYGSRSIKRILHVGGEEHLCGTRQRTTEMNKTPTESLKVQPDDQIKIRTREQRWRDEGGA